VILAIACLLAGGVQQGRRQRPRGAARALGSAFFTPDARSDFACVEIPFRVRRDRGNGVERATILRSLDREFALWKRTFA
jgi:hypothetical protein